MTDNQLGFFLLFVSLSFLLSGRLSTLSLHFSIRFPNFRSLILNFQESILIFQLFVFFSILFLFPECTFSSCLRVLFLGFCFLFSWSLECSLFLELFLLPLTCLGVGHLSLLRSGRNLPVILSLHIVIWEEESLVVSSESCVFLILLAERWKGGNYLFSTTL